MKKLAHIINKREGLDMEGIDSIKERITIEITENLMSAFVTFEAPFNDGDQLTRNEIIKEIEKYQIKKGINKSVLAEILSKRAYGKKYLLAAGLKAGMGKNGEVVTNFDISKQSFKPVLKQDGTVDYKNLDNITLAKKGEVIAELIPPTKGEDGYNVNGEVLEGKEGKPVQMPKGKGTSVSEDGRNLLAEIDGRIIYADGKISISEVYEIRGDVGPATGNINFNGSVIVRGNVTTDFSIHATGNIEVFGIVEGAEMYAGGNILVSNGISGVTKAIINANGNITSKSIQNATLEAKGDIFSEAIMHSTIKSYGRVEIGGSKGLLVGGKVQCYNGLHAKVVGSYMGTKTEIHIGGDSDYLSEYNEMLNEHSKINTKYKENIEHLDKMMKKRKKDQESEANVNNSLLNTINTTNSMKAQLDKLKEKIEELRALVETDVSIAILSVESVAFPGVILRIGNAKTVLEREENRVSFRNKDGIITTGVF